MVYVFVVFVIGVVCWVGCVFVEYFVVYGYCIVVYYDCLVDVVQVVVCVIVECGYDLVVLQVDLFDVVQIIMLIDQVYVCFGCFDVLVNNVLVFWQDYFLSFDFVVFDQVWVVNCCVLILFMCVFYEWVCVVGMQGVVVNVVDQKIKENFYCDYFSYMVVKVVFGNLMQMFVLLFVLVLCVNVVFLGLMLLSDDQMQVDFEYVSCVLMLFVCIVGFDDVVSVILLLMGNVYNGVDFVVDVGQNLICVDQDVLYKYCLLDGKY